MRSVAFLNLSFDSLLSKSPSQISLQRHFNKIIKGPGTSLKSPALSQKYVRNVGHRSNQYLTKFILVVFRIQKINVTSMLTPQILKSLNFTKTQKSRYLENKIFFLQKKGAEVKTCWEHEGSLKCCQKITVKEFI